MPIRFAMFDFDGTLSLIREGWSGIMADIGVRLVNDPTGRDEIELAMLQLSGHASIVQMHRLREIAGGGPPAEELLDEFREKLAERTDVRKRRIRDRIDSPDAWMVPGSRGMLEELRSRDVHLVLASGTPMEALTEEVDLLGLGEFFGERVYAPTGNSANFSKASVLAKYRERLNLSGLEIVGFGDGYAETVAVVEAGGLAIGLASREAGEPGENAMKAAMLRDLGATIIVPDYGELMRRGVANVFPCSI